MVSADSSLIAAAKLAGRIVTNEFDSEIERHLNAALLDMGVAGVELPAEIDPLVEQAAITYFLLHFGEPDNYDKLERSYNEQKAQLSTHSGYTNWMVNRNG
jgi:hypothetical protein